MDWSIKFDNDKLWLVIYTVDKNFYYSEELKRIEIKEILKKLEPFKNLVN